MKTLSTYRTLSVTLAAIFFVFNIGLPLIVASCPMAKSPGQMMCSTCPNPANSTSPQFTTIQNTSCCATIIAANRNTNEFVRISNTIGDIAKIVAVISQISIQSVDNQSATFCINDCSSSPPPARDIPILVSSLLI